MISFAIKYTSCLRLSFSPFHVYLHVRLGNLTVLSQLIVSNGTSSLSDGYSVYLVVPYHALPVQST